MILIFYWLCMLASCARAEQVPDVELTARVQHAAVAGDDVVVVTFPAADRLVERAGATVARVRPGIAGAGYTSRGTDALVVNGESWWYASLDGIGRRAATTFVRSDGTRVTHAAPGRGPTKSYLIAFPEDEPRALDFTSTLDGTIVRELDWSGSVRTWDLPRDHDLWPHLTAERLPDGRIALFSSRSGLTLYLLGDDGVVETRVLRNAHVTQFDTAIDEAGRIAIVVASQAGVGAAVLSVDEEPQWTILRRDVQVAGRLREVQVVRGARGFVGAWIRDGRQRRIEAAELARPDVVVEIGPASPRGNSAFFDFQPLDDALVFFWDDGEHLFRRRTPADLSTVAILNAADEACGRSTH